MTSILSATIHREIDDLAKAHEGTACFSGALICVDDARLSISGYSLLDDSLRARIHDRFKQRFGIFEERAVYSIWMKWYLNTFLPPVLLADVLLRRSLTIQLDHVRFFVSDDGRISEIGVPNEAIDTTNVDPFARLAPLFLGHLEPLIDRLSERSNVTRRVYWSNVGNTYEAMLRRIESVAGRSPRLLEAQKLLEEPFWLDGRSNPIAGAVRYESNVRLRRVCCLQYLLPDRRFCQSCPVDEARSLHHTPSSTC